MELDVCDRIFLEVISVDPGNEYLKELRINISTYERFCMRLMIYPIRVVDRYLPDVFGCSAVVDDVDGYILILGERRPEPVKFPSCGMIKLPKAPATRFWGLKW